MNSAHTYTIFLLFDFDKIVYNYRMDINTCIATTIQYHTTAFYAHLVPIVLALFLSVYSLVKSKFSGLSIVFFSFCFGFCLWLIGSLVDWVYSDYFWVYFTWSWLDFINIVFFVLGAYFFGLLSRGKISTWERIIFLALCAPAFVLTFVGNSVVDFYHPVCEATNNQFLTGYKFWAEGVIVMIMLYQLFSVWKKTEKHKKIQSSIVLLALLLFFAVFGLTEYIASITGLYEINLYGLFVLPLFIIVMVFSITNLGLFQFRLLGTQILAYALIIVVGSQFLFIQNSTDRELSIITLVIAILLGALLIRNANQEIKHREKIEKLAKELGVANGKLMELDHLKSEFLSLATHQIRAPLTAIKGYSSMLADGDFGILPQKAKESARTITKSCQNLINIVEEFLNISRIEQGRMIYEKSIFDMGELIEEVAEEFKPAIDRAGLTLKLEIPKYTEAKVNADRNKIKQIIGNILDNAVKYTVRGSIDISVFLEKELDRQKEMVKIEVKDSGVGIDHEEIGKLFSKFSRTKNANRTNVHGTGLGLYIAKKMAEAHGGSVKIFSKGLGHGSTVIIELPIYK
jgi:signal transduction histidine kinase